MTGYIIGNATQPMHDRAKIVNNLNTVNFQVLHMTSVDQVMSALKKIMDPELNKDIVSMGMIKDLTIKDKNVSFTLELTTPACPFNTEIEQEVRNSMQSIGVNELDLRVTAKVMEGRAVSMDELLPKVKNIFAVASGKGGVGKTTVAVNLALALARTGASVGLLDADIYGPSVPLMLGIKDTPPIVNNKIQPVISNGIKVISMGFFYEQSQQAGRYRGPIVSGIIKQFITDVEWGELDYLLIDLPPGTGDAPLTMAQTLPITGVLIVTTPQDVAMNVAIKSVGMFNKLNIPILGVVENMSFLVCPHCGEKTYTFGKGGGQKISDNFSVPFLGEIPLHPLIREGSDLGRPVTLVEPESPASLSFAKISRLVAGRISVIAASVKDNDIAEKASTAPM